MFSQETIVYEVGIYNQGIKVIIHYGLLEIYPNKDDGLVKTMSATFLRHITKLCILECAQK